MTKSNLGRVILATASIVALAGCGASEIASPGGGPINLPGTPGGGTNPGPNPTPSGKSVAAAACPTVDAQPTDAGLVPGLTDQGPITTPSGSWRVCRLASRFTTSTTLPYVQGVLYEMNGRVDVGNDLGPVAQAGEKGVTLTIGAGSIVYGDGASWMAVNRGNKLNAVGTEDKPIVFTSKKNVEGKITPSDESGQWGGVVLLGRAPITDCRESNATPGTTACSRQTEGATSPALYGGATPTDNSGELKYVQLRYSGHFISDGNELQALTTGGTGSGTKLNFIQSYNSSDDGVEFFGGLVDVKNLLIVGAEDDSLDTDTGVKARMQHVLVVQRVVKEQGDSFVEADTDNAYKNSIPRQNTKLANFTFISAGSNVSNKTGILLRGGTDYTMVNGLVISGDKDSCLKISSPETIQAADPAKDEMGPPKFYSVNMQCKTNSPFAANNVTLAQVEAVFGAGSNNNSITYVPSLTKVYINGANEAKLVATDPKTIDNWFDSTNYVGAIKDAASDWTKKWTCSSVTADFGTSQCASLPVYTS